MINFNCGGCGCLLQISDEFSGQLGGCPHCGTNSRVPGNPRRTAKTTIVFRLIILPVLFFSAFGLLACVTGQVHFGLIIIGSTIVGGLGTVFFLWAVMNIIAFLINPKYYFMWKNGGGDPFFDTTGPIINNDPDSTRYQEFYRETLRQEQGGYSAPPAPGPGPSGINNPNIMG